MIQSKRRFTPFLWFYLFVALAFMGGGFAGMMDSATGPYYDLIEFAICFSLFGIGVRLFILALHHFDKLTIDHEMLYVRSIFHLTRKKIHLPSIQYWTEKVITERGLRYLKLSIYNEKKLYTINTHFFENEQAIIDTVTMFGYRNIEKESRAVMKKHSIISIVSFILSGVVLIASVYFYFKSPKAPVTSEQLSSINGILSEDPVVVKGSKGSSYIKFRLEGYPGFRFDVSGRTYSATYVDVFKQRMEQGDSIFVNIDRTEFQKKISHEIPLGFFDKTVSYTTIHVIEMEGKGLVFLSLNDYNIANKGVDNKQVALTLLILCICLILMGRQQKMKAMKMKDVYGK